jgi:hypothetical protein
MGISIQRRRGTTVQTSFFTGKVGEVTVRTDTAGDTTKPTLVVHDGVTSGGIALAHEVHTHAEATTSIDGFLSASDKIKLNSIAAGGTLSYQVIQANGVDQTARLKTNYSTNFSIADGGGSSNSTGVDLSTTGVSTGTFTKVTVDAYGRIQTGTILSSGDIPSLSYSKITDFGSGVQTVRLDQLAHPTANVSMNSFNIINMADPVSSTDAATKQYVDSTATGLTFKDAVRVASTTNVNISAPGTTIDMVSLNLGDRILLKDQIDQTTNGIYNFNGPSGTLSRSNDANSSSEVNAGLFVLVTEGHLSAGIGYVLSTPNPISLGTTNLVFVPFSSGSGSVTAGNGINVNGSIVSVASANVGRIAVSSSGVDLATIGGLVPGTYQQFTVDAYGRITGTTSAVWQTSNAGLSALAALSINGFVSRTGTTGSPSYNTFSARTLQPGTGIQITNGDGSAGNPTIGVVNNQTIQKINVANNGSTIGSRSTVNLIPGTGTAFTIADNAGNDRVDVTIGLTPGGGGAPSTSQYVTMALDATLSNERVLTVGTGITLTDGGSNGNVTLALVTDFGTVP